MWINKDKKRHTGLTKFKLYLFYNDYETSYTTYINHVRWHRCLRSDGLRVEGNRSARRKPICLTCNILVTHINWHVLNNDQTSYDNDMPWIVMHGNNTIIYDDDVAYFNYGYLTTSLSLTETPTLILSIRAHLILNLRAHNV